MKNNPKNIHEGQKWGIGSVIEVKGVVRIDENGNKYIECKDWTQVRVIKEVKR